jgi:hypothetical protein
MPPTKRLVVVTVVADNVPAFNEFPVAFPKVSVPIDPMFELIELPVADVKVRRPVAARLVAVVLASVEEPVTISVPPFKEPIVARLIFTDVPDAVVNPSELVKSDVEVTPTRVASPVTFNVPATFKVPVTELDAATKPPRSSIVVVVNDPRAVTVANVSLKTVPAGQPTPLERQMAKPMTVAVAKFPELATIEDPLAVVNPSELVKSEVDVTPASVEEPVITRVPPFNTPMLAVLIFALVPEAAVKPKEFVNSDVEVAPASVVLPVTFNVPATFRVPVTELDAATNPPKNSTVVVVNDPRAVTDWRVSRPTAAQFTPFARQTAIPPTKRLVVVTVVADSVPAFKELPVAFPKVSVPIDPMFELIELPVAEVKVRRPVAARLVAVVFASVEEPVTISVPPFKEPMVAKLIFTDVPEAVANPSELVKSDVEVTPTRVAFPVTFNVPATFNVPVTLDEAATNPPNRSIVVVVNDPRAVTVANVSLKTVPAGQPTPLERQTAKPMTVAVAKFPELAIIEEPVADEKLSKPVDAKFVDVAF